ncbi:MAG: kinase/pyrophosphorylase [Planctomycetes bacterium]|nr:kinase/pyrophosphorylase [Planctomycetota bacterium]
MQGGPNILVVSDATGATAESVLTSVLVQFPAARFQVWRFPFVRTTEQIEEILRQRPEQDCVVVYTLVSAGLRQFLAAKGRERGWTVVDVMGPLIDSLSEILHSAPNMIPGAFRHHPDETYRLTEAINYTLAHDDGHGVETLEQADLIILGVSRTGKTPASIYLSCRKLKVANIPIVKGIALPEKVFNLPVKKVGLRMAGARLVELRAERMKRMASADVLDYSSRAHVNAELDYCEQIFRKMPSCCTIDVTNRSIEETADWIVRTVL